MFDLRIQRNCSHEIFAETATIQGTSPNYFSILRFPCDGSSNFVSVREFSKTESMNDFIYARDGFTNWTLSTDNRQINWNTQGIGVSGSASFLDGTSFILPQPTWILDYRTTINNCPLCTPALPVSKDIEFDPYGQIRTVSGTDKVKQQLFKALLTYLGSNSIIPDYGSTLSDGIGQKFDSFTEYSIYSSVMQAIQFLINEQANQSNLPLNETILSASSIGAVQDLADPRILKITINVKLGDFSITTVSFGMITG